MTNDFGPIFSPIDSDEKASAFLSSYVEKANQALYAWHSQVGPMAPTAVYNTVLKMDTEERIAAESPREKDNKDLMMKVLKAFSECYEVTCRLKAEIDKYMEDPEIKKEVEAAKAQDELKTFQGMVN